MHDPVAAGRHIAARAVVVQIGAVAITAALCLIVGPRQAFAAVIGGMALALGNALAASVSLAGMSSASVAFGRLMLGTATKWLVVISGFAMGLLLWRLPPLPMFAGLVAGLVAYLLALNVPKLSK